ncbi:hypothetical protein [Clostridium sardiniense]|uniref:hypothetical protein n=1 Tax=Clostridium sardiniense TaxID=29369 RepID=UPI00195E45FA|nr:hypothetical protein [Clostridium sardiniense]MBM7836327.1 hypothetical protein [Clostridium sardiniense]
MIIEGTEVKLVNASIYIKKAILEVKNIPCECTNDDYCWRCCLLDDLKNQRSCIDEEISERFT